MYVEEIHFWNCYLNGFGPFEPGNIDLWPNDPKTDRQTDRPICAKQYALTSLKGGIKNMNPVIIQNTDCSMFKISANYN